MVEHRGCARQVPDWPLRANARHQYILLTPPPDGRSLVGSEPERVPYRRTDADVVLATAGRTGGATCAATLGRKPSSWRMDWRGRRFRRAGIRAAASRCDADDGAEPACGRLSGTGDAVSRGRNAGRGGPGRHRPLRDRRRRGWRRVPGCRERIRHAVGRRARAAVGHRRRGGARPLHVRRGRHGARPRDDRGRRATRAGIRAPARSW